jgi:hypothetical protein
MSKGLVLVHNIFFKLPWQCHIIRSLVPSSPFIENEVFCLSVCRAYNSKTVYLVWYTKGDSEPSPFFASSVVGNTSRSFAARRRGDLLHGGMATPGEAGETPNSIFFAYSVSTVNSLHLTSVTMSFHCKFPHQHPSLCWDQVPSSTVAITVPARIFSNSDRLYTSLSAWIQSISVCRCKYSIIQLINLCINLFHSDPSHNLPSRDLRLLEQLLTQSKGFESRKYC